MLYSIFGTYLAGLLIDGDKLASAVHVCDDEGLRHIAEETGLHILAVLLVVRATPSIISQNGNVLKKRDGCRRSKVNARPHPQR